MHGIFVAVLHYRDHMQVEGRNLVINESSFHLSYSTFWHLHYGVPKENFVTLGCEIGGLQKAQHQSFDWLQYFILSALASFYSVIVCFKHDPLIKVSRN